MGGSPTRAEARTGAGPALCPSSAAVIRAFRADMVCNRRGATRSLVDMDAQRSLGRIPQFVSATIAVEALLEAVMGLRLQLGQRATHIVAPLDADGQSARHGS